MVITHKDRKTVIKYHTPANYAIIDSVVYCMAGFGMVSDWYRNISANPKAEIWLPNGMMQPVSWWVGFAEEITDLNNKLPIIRQLIIASAFTGRLAWINPNMPDEELDKITSVYQLIQIMPAEPHTGPGGWMNDHGCGLLPQHSFFYSFFSGENVKLINFQNPLRKTHCGNVN